MTPELWLSISDFPNYEVSSLGRVRRTNNSARWKAGMILGDRPDKDGYARVVLYASRATKSLRVHRLVAEAFIGQIPEGMQVNHKNGAKDDNKLENLEIVTPSENTRHGFRALGRKPVINPMQGTSHGNSKLTEDAVRQIRLLYSQGSTQEKIAKQFGTDQTNISKIIRRTAWSHVT
jgi:hypothetical protein